MEILEYKFFLFWAAISAIFLILGFRAIENTELSSSVPRHVMLLLKHTWAIITCYSSNHAFRRSGINKFVDTYLTGIMILVILAGGSLVSCWSPIFTVVIQFNLFIIASDKGRFSSKWKIVLYACYLLATVFLSVPGLRWTHPKSLANILAFCEPLSTFPAFVFLVWNKWCQEDESLPTSEAGPDLIRLTIVDGNKYDMIKRPAEFAVGLLGTILFQSFFRINSFNEVLAFLYLAVAWLADVTLLSSSHDFGVLNFLLGNVLVGCSVSEFGLKGKTWIAYAAAVLVHCLRLKLQSLSFVNKGLVNRRVVLW